MGFPPSILKAKARPKRDGFDSGDERRYAERLDLLVKAGEIREWRHHKVRFCIGDGAWYTPDFEVIANDGTIEYHEVKGFQREAAIVRFKAARQQNPHFTFKMIQRRKSEWVELHPEAKGQL